MVSPDSSKKKVANLRVQDLKLELEKRGLDHKGVKAVLLERLQKALVENGEDPNEIVVDSPATPKGTAAKKTPTRKRASKGKSGDEEGESDYEGEDGMEGLGVDGMVVDEVTDEMETSQEESAQKSTEEIDLDIILGGHEEDDDDVLNISLEEDQLFEEETEGFAPDIEKASSNQEDKMEAEDSSAPEVEESKDTDGGDSLALDTSLEIKGEGSESLVVHVDEPFMSELDEELAESTTPKKSEDNQGDASTDQGDDNQLAEAQMEAQKEKGESDSPEKTNKDDKSPVGDAKKEEKGDEKVTPAKASSAGKDSSADKRGTSSAGAANSRSKSSSSSGRSPTSKDDKERRGSGSSRPASGTTSGRNLWVSNLSRNTRAADLKASFSKYGKVVGAKVVTNARGPRAFCYGFVSMSSSSEAAKAINHLHRTELHGRTIHVERARSNMIPVASTSGASGRKKEPSPERKEVKDRADKKPADKAEAKDAKSTSEAAKKDDKPAAGAAVAATTTPESKDEKTTTPSEMKDGEAAKEEVLEESKKDEKTPADAPKQTANTDKPAETTSPEKKTEAAEKKEGDDKCPSSSRSSTADKDKPDSKDRKDILSLEKIKEQRMRERQRKRERDQREMERRRERERQDSLRREREIIRRRQREEEEKLRREREQLRLAQQQERLERQTIEWERMKLHQERENLQRELEQHRQMEVQLRLAAERQATLKRTLDTRNMAPRDVDPYIGDQKRRQPTAPQARGDFGNNSQNRAAMSTNVVNTERPPDRFNRRDTRQTDAGPRRDNPPTNKFSGPPNRARDDVRRNDQGRRDEPRREDVRQRPPNRNEPVRREDQTRRSGPPQRPGPPQRRDDPPPPPPQPQQPPPQQRRGPDNFRRDDGMKRRDQPDRRIDTAQRQPARNEPARRDSRGEGNMRDDRRGQPQNQGDRYQGGQGQSRVGNVPSYGGRDGSQPSNIRDGHRERDRDDRADRSRDSTHQAQSRIGGDNWKGGRDSGVSGPSGRSSSHSDWKSNQRSGDRTYDRDNRSQNYERGQGNNWSSDGRSGGRDDNMMRGSEQHSHRASLLGTPPIQDTTWAQSTIDAPMHRGSGNLVMPGTSHISTLMNQSQPISSLLSSPAMSGPFISSGSVSGGLGGGVGMMQQVPLGAGSGSSYIGNQIGVGTSGGSGGTMDRHRSSQSDGRFAMRRY